MFAARSPVRIAIAVLAMVLACQFGFGMAIATIRTRTNDHAATESIRLLTARLSQLRANLSSVANDYNHWTEASEALGHQASEWMSENYGLSATNGEIFDGVAFFDGPLARPWAWSAAHPQVEPSPSFLDGKLLDLIRREVALQALGAKETYDTAAVIEGRLALVSATRTQPANGGAPSGLDPAKVPIAVLTETLEPAELGDLADTLSFGDLSFGPAPVPGSTSVSVAGLDSSAIGFLSWTPPQPGNALLMGMLPVLAGLVAMNLALGAAAA